MVKAVIFDKDGTLFDFTATWGPWTADLLRDLADDAEHADRLARAVGFDLATCRFDPASPVIAGTPGDSARALEAALPGMTLDTIVRILIERSRDVVPTPAVPLAPLLSELKGRGLALAVVTNDAEGPALEQLDGHAHHFAFIAGCDSGHGAKPDPDPLLAAARALGHAAEDCIMVGDSLHDIRAAHAAGMRALGVLTGPATELPGAEAVLPDIGHLPRWLDTTK